MNTIWITTTFEGFHHWPDAPEKYAYLRNSHRHIFHVRLEVEVKHTNRELEFIALKNDVTNFCKDELAGTRALPTTYSCEKMCEILVVSYMQHEKLPIISVTISEDGENGATWYSSEFINKNVRMPAPVIR